MHQPGWLDDVLPILLSFIDSSCLILPLSQRMMRCIWRWSATQECLPNVNKMLDSSVAITAVEDHQEVPRLQESSSVLIAEFDVCHDTCWTFISRA